MLPPAHRPNPSDEIQHIYPPMEPGRELLLSDMLQVLRRRRFIIAGCTLLGLLLAVFYILLRDPRYEAQAQIEVTPANTNQLGLDEIRANASNPNESTLQLQAAVKILQSNILALSVMDELALSQNKAFAGRWQQSRGTNRRSGQARCATICCAGSRRVSA